LTTDQHGSGKFFTGSSRLDKTGADEGYPLYESLDTLGTVSHAYEGLHEALKESSAADML
jgi:hypothetical protein